MRFSRIGGLDVGIIQLLALAKLRERFFTNPNFSNILRNGTTCSAGGGPENYADKSGQFVPRNKAGAARSRHSFSVGI
jgi:hypothetical protein